MNEELRRALEEVVTYRQNMSEQYYHAARRFITGGSKSLACLHQDEAAIHSAVARAILELILDDTLQQKEPTP